MDILMVTPELSPYAKASDTGDAVLGLAKALRQAGHQLTLALPRYPTFEAHGLLVARRLSPLPIGEGREVMVFDGQLPSGIGLVLFDVPGMFDAGVFSEAATPERQLEQSRTLSLAAAALGRQRAEQKKPFDVVHLHDWPAALTADYLDGSASSVVLTVHDARRQGRFASNLASGLPDTAQELGGGTNLLKVGIERAGAVTTVAPSYVAQLSDPEVTGPLADVFRGLSREPTGIVGGVDYAIFNPATDPALESRYDAEDPSNKGRTKAAVLRQLGLELELERPLAVLTGALDRDHGADIVLASVPEFSQKDVALAVVGSGDPKLEEGFARAHAETPLDLAFVPSGDDALVRRLTAASDFVLVPSRYEPCGTRQIVAQRYGGLPIARSAGGIVDTIVDCEPALETGTGFLFDEPTPEALLGAVERALSAFASGSWSRLRRRVMRLDLSWDRASRRYLQVYREARTSA